MAKRRTSKATEPKTSKRSKSINSTDAATTLNYCRDPEYYFEDGSVILLVQDVLFKIHASLLKAQSQVFQDMFTMPAGNVNSTEGTLDQDPIVIPQVQASRFRNLLKMIYSPASSAFHASLTAWDSERSDLDKHAWNAFTFYLDVATLCHRFGMAEMEKWARRTLRTHVSSRTKEISRGASADPVLLLEAIQYAKAAQDRQLVKNIHHLAYYYIYFWTDDFESGQLMTLFRVPGLRENHPSIFGCIFSTFLSHDHSVWEREPFTKVDRMALFSAQVRLSPVPGSFKKDIHSPLFEQPSSLEDFRKAIGLDLCSNEPCGHKCDKKIREVWLREFEEEYYDDGADVSWFPTLARYRHEFVQGAEKIMCCRDCSTQFIDQLDRDIELVYVRMGEYYREIE